MYTFKDDLSFEDDEITLSLYIYRKCTTKMYASSLVNPGLFLSWVTLET